jgi:hypothetical protein
MTFAMTIPPANCTVAPLMLQNLSLGHFFSLATLAVLQDDRRSRTWSTVEVAIFFTHSIHGPKSRRCNAGRSNISSQINAQTWTQLLVRRNAGHLLDSVGETYKGRKDYLANLTLKSAKAINWAPWDRHEVAP